MRPVILLVDDLLSLREQVANALGQDDRFRLISARGPVSARELIAKNFIAAAFVDLGLGDKDDPGNGLDVLDYLRRHRPSARRILYSRDAHSPLEFRKILNSVHPTVGVAHAVWCSGDGPFLDTLIKDYAQKSGLLNQVTVEGTGDAVTSVLHRAESWYRTPPGSQQMSDLPRLAVCEEEVAFAMSSAIWPSVKDGERDISLNDRVTQVRLSPLTRGKSRSCVFEGRTYTSLDNSEGIRFVMKVGPKEEIEDEVMAYERCVKFFRHSAKRVELLAHSLLDTVGVVCYSFAGHAEHEGIVSWQQVLDSGDLRHTVAALRGELSPLKKIWYRATARVTSEIGVFFEKTYGMDLPSTLERPTGIVRELLAAGRISGYIDTDSLGRSEWRLPKNQGHCLLPRSRDLAELNGHMRTWMSCVVHGDFNGENLLLNGDYREKGVRWVLPIDYRFTGRGPVFLDFAALEATVRCTDADLRESQSRDDLSYYADLANVEDSLAKEAWGGDVGYEMEPNHDVDENSPMWRAVSLELVRLARGNFVSSAANVNAARREYVATCCFYVMRLLRVRKLYSPNTEAAQLRLLVWMSSMLRFLRSEKLS
jgi:hypothetical protein